MHEIMHFLIQPCDFAHTGGFSAVTHRPHWSPRGNLDRLDRALRPFHADLAIVSGPRLTRSS